MRLLKTETDPMDYYYLQLGMMCIEFNALPTEVLKQDFDEMIAIMEVKKYFAAKAAEALRNNAGRKR